MIHFIDYLDPLSYVSHTQYLSFWRVLFEAVLQGFWAKLLASSSLFLAFFVGVYRQKVVAGVFFFFLAVVLAYGGPLLKLILGF